MQLTVASSASLSLDIEPILVENKTCLKLASKTCKPYSTRCHPQTTSWRLVEIDPARTSIFLKRDCLTYLFLILIKPDSPSAIHIWVCPNASMGKFILPLWAPLPLLDPLLPWRQLAIALHQVSRVWSCWRSTCRRGTQGAKCVKMDRPEPPREQNQRACGLVEALELNQVQQSHGTNGQDEGKNSIHRRNSLC